MWPAPNPGDIVWCHFPQRPRDLPGPKPRPALVLAVDEYEDGAVVKVAYGTSQHLDHMHTGEFAIRKVGNPAAYALAGLSYDTKFDLKQVVTIPWDDAFFSVAPLAPRGKTPIMGTLHPSMLKQVESAARSCPELARSTKL